MAPRERLLEIALLPARGAAAARADRHPRGPRLRAATAPAGMLLAFFPVVLASFVVRNLSTMERRVRRGVAAEPRARRHARDLDHLRRQRARRPLRARLRRRRAPAAGRGHGRHRVAGRRGRGPRGARLREGRRGPAARSWPGRGAAASTSAASSAGALPRSSPSATRARSAWRPARATRCRVRLSTFELHSGLLVLEGSDPGAPRAGPVASLRTLADHIALVLQDRAIRAQIAGALRAQPGARRDAQPDPRDLQRPQEEPDPRRSLPVDRLGRRARPRLPAGRCCRSTTASSNVFMPHGPTSASTSAGRTCGGGTSPPTEITRHWTERNRVSKSFHVRDRSARETPRRAVATARQRASRPARTAGTRTRSSGSRSTPSDRLLGCLSVDEPKNGQSPTLETDPLARDLRQPGRHRDRERPRPTTRPASSRSATR